MYASPAKKQHVSRPRPRMVAGRPLAATSVPGGVNRRSEKTSKAPPPPTPTAIAGTSPEVSEAKATPVPMTTASTGRKEVEVLWAVVGGGTCLRATTATEPAT